MIEDTIPKLTDQEFDLLQSYIEQESSIKVDKEKNYLLESRLKGLVKEFDCKSFGELYRLATSGSSQAPTLRGRMIDAITTNETLWFRDDSPFKILNDVFLPEMARQISRGKPKVRIWSAASSTGQEAYSIAISIMEFCERHGGGIVTPAHFEILATDISSKALGLARAGAYDSLSMNRGMGDLFRAKYFTQEHNQWVIDERLKQVVDFQQFNLKSDFSKFGTFDVIFCRNVAIYFAHEFKVDLFQRMRRSLRPGGLFFLGTSETLTYYGSGFQTKDYENHTYYEA